MKRFLTYSIYLTSMIVFSMMVFLASCGDDSPKEATPVEVINSVTSSVLESGTPALATPVSRGAEISLEFEERDFGTIWDHESVTTTFPFTNTGSLPLVLTRLQAGCGCTTPVADKTVLQPGESGTITVTFDPRGKSKKQDKKVTIFSNALSNPEQAFWIRSTVKPFINVDNKFLSLDEMVLGEQKVIEFNIYPVDPDFEISSIQGTGKHGQYVNAYELDMPEGEPRRIRIEILPTMPWGAFHSQVIISGKGKVEDGSEVFHSLTVFANGKTFGKIKADQHIISIGTLQKGGAYHKRIRIYRPDGQPFKVLNTAVLQPTVSGINATAVQSIDGSYDIIVSGTLPISHSGPINAEVMVQTDVPTEEVLKFRVAGVVSKR